LTSSTIIEEKPTECLVSSDDAAGNAGAGIAGGVAQIVVRPLVDDDGRAVVVEQALA